MVAFSLIITKTVPSTPKSTQRAILLTMSFINLYHGLFLIVFGLFFTASICILVCPIGLLFIGVLTDKYGKRKTIQITLIPMIISWLLLAFANSYATIMIARVILGIPIGKLLFIFINNLRNKSNLSPPSKFGFVYELHVKVQAGIFCFFFFYQNVLNFVQFIFLHYFETKLFQRF